MTSPPSLPLVENGMIWDGVAAHIRTFPLLDTWWYAEIPANT